MDNFFVSSYNPGDTIVGAVAENVGHVGILVKRIKTDPLSPQPVWSWQIDWLYADDMYEPEEVFDPVIPEEELRDQLNQCLWLLIKVRK